MYKQSQGVEPGGLIELGNPACGHSVDMTLAIVDVKLFQCHAIHAYRLCPISFS